MKQMREIEPTPPGYWGSGSEHIVIFENVLSPSELSELHRYANCNDDWSAVSGQYHWMDRVHRTITESSAKSIIKSLHDSMRSITQNHFGVFVQANGIQLNRWRVGDSQNPHADKQELDGGPNCCPMYDLSSIFYINDDYGGGEVFFPKQNLSISPPANTVLSFPGDINYLHGVNEVTFGVRYTVSVFWTVTKIKVNDEN